MPRGHDVCVLLSASGVAEMAPEFHERHRLGVETALAALRLRLGWRVRSSSCSVSRIYANIHPAPCSIPFYVFFNRGQITHVFPPPLEERGTRQLPKLTLLIISECAVPWQPVWSRRRADTAPAQPRSGLRLLLPHSTRHPLPACPAAGHQHSALCFYELDGFRSRM